VHHSAARRRPRLAALIGVDNMQRAPAGQGGPYEIEIAFCGLDQVAASLHDWLPDAVVSAFSPRWPVLPFPSRIFGSPFTM
jgi:hypothetical protein